MSLWLECDSGLKNGEHLIDIATGKTPVVPDNRDLTVNLGAFHNGYSRDLSTATQIDFNLYESSANDAASFLTKTISSGIAARTGRSPWNKREAASVTFQLTDTELNYSLGAEDSVDLWARISATLSGGEVIPLAEGVFTIGFNAG